MKPKGLGIVTTQAAPQAIGPYSQAVVVDATVYTAGQIAPGGPTGLKNQLGSVRTSVGSIPTRSRQLASTLRLNKKDAASAWVALDPDQLPRALCPESRFGDPEGG